MIGTDDLGQYILKALSDKNGIGNGLMLGLCVAFLGLAVDHLIRTWADQKKSLWAWHNHIYQKIFSGSGCGFDLRNFMVV